MFRRWDLLLLVAVVALVAAAGGVDVRLGLLALAVSLGGVWYWLGDAGGDG